MVCLLHIYYFSIIIIIISDYLLLPCHSILHSASEGSDIDVVESDAADGTEQFGWADNAMQRDFAA